MTAHEAQQDTVLLDLRDGAQGVPPGRRWSRRRRRPPPPPAAGPPLPAGPRRADWDAPRCNARKERGPVHAGYRDGLFTRLHGLRQRGDGQRRGDRKHPRDAATASGPPRPCPPRMSAHPRLWRSPRGRATAPLDEGVENGVGRAGRALTRPPPPQTRRSRRTPRRRLNACRRTARPRTECRAPPSAPEDGRQRRRRRREDWSETSRRTTAGERPLRIGGHQLHEPLRVLLGTELQPCASSARSARRQVLRRAPAVVVDLTSRTARAPATERRADRVPPPPVTRGRTARPQADACGRGQRLGTNRRT